jgi:hypothetical protein
MPSMLVSIGNEAEAAGLKPASTQRISDDFFILRDAFNSLCARRKLRAEKGWSTASASAEFRRLPDLSVQF